MMELGRRDLPRAAGLWVVALLIPSCGSGHHPSPTLVAFAASFRSPAPGTSNVSRTVTVYVSFTRPTNGITVNVQTMTLSAAGATVPSQVIFQSCNELAILVPSSPLQASTVYTVQLSSGILDGNGTPLSPESFTFQTGPFVDVTPPAFAGAASVTLMATSALVTWVAAVDNLDPSAAIVYDVFVSTTSG